MQAGVITIKPFKNYYCEALPCALGGYYAFLKDDERRLSMEDIKVLCELAIVKNMLAGVRFLYLKLPFFVDIEDLFDKYGVEGGIILPALEIFNIPTKALIGERLIIEIQSFSDLSDAFLGQLANFVGDWKLPILLNLGDNLLEVGKVVNRFKLTPTELAESYGFLDRKCLVMGLNHVDKDDLLLLKNYDAFAIISPRDDANEGRGFVNNYNLIYNDFPFGFASGKCYNIDMLGEGRLSIQNTCNLMSEGGVISWKDLEKALSCPSGELEINFDKDCTIEAILEERVSLGVPDEKLIEKVKQIAKKLKEKK